MHYLCWLQDMRRRCSYSVLLSILIVFMTGCASMMKQARGVSHVKGEIYLAPATVPDANGNSPIAVDVVSVRGATLLKEVSKLTALAWFQQKTSLAQLHPGDLSTSSWEWVPGQAIAKVKVPEQVLPMTFCCLRITPLLGRTAPPSPCPAP